MKRSIIDTLMRLLRRTVPYDGKVYRWLYYIFIRMNSISRLKGKKPSDMEVQIHTVDHCNLKCKYCNAFAPIINECYADIGELKRDLVQLSILTKGTLKSLTISGGEPMLHPLLPEIMEIAREHFPGQHLQIITNGIVLESAPIEFWEACKIHNIYISLTNYPIDLNIAAIKKLAVQHGAKLVYQDDTDIRKKTMFYSPLDPGGAQDPNTSYRLCHMANRDFVLENGKLYTCPTIAHIKYINSQFNQNFIVTDKDYIDIYEITSIDNALLFFSDPMHFCKYCMKKHRVSGLNWELSEEDISEWIINL